MDVFFRFACPACGKTLKAKPEQAGKRAQCSCGQPVVVPNHEIGDREEGSRPDSISGGPQRTRHDLLRRFHTATRLLVGYLAFQTILTVAVGIAWILSIVSADGRADPSKLVPQCAVVLLASAIPAALAIFVFRKHRWALYVVGILAGFGIAGAVFNVTVSLVYEKNLIWSLVGLVLAVALVALGRNA